MAKISNVTVFSKNTSPPQISFFLIFFFKIKYLPRLNRLSALARLLQFSSYGSITLKEENMRPCSRPESDITD
jgi:hypothetical protein